MLRKIDTCHADAGQRRAMSLGAAHALAALLLEDANLRTARLAVDHAQHPDVGDKRGAGEDFAAILLEKEDAVDAHFVARAGVEAVDFDDGPGSDLDLPPAALNDCEHL